MPRSLRAARLAGAGILLLGAVPSRAQDAPTTVIIDASPSVPPFSTPQDATEPTATVNREALTRFVAPTGDDDTAVRLTPPMVDLDGVLDRLVLGEAAWERMAPLIIGREAPGVRASQRRARRDAGPSRFGVTRGPRRSPRA